MLVVVLIVAATTSQAVTVTFTGNGNWSDASLWGGSLPAPTDAAVISAGSVCNMDMNDDVASLTIQGGTMCTRLQFSGAFTLTVTGSVVLQAPTADNIGTSLRVNTGSLSCTSITMPTTATAFRSDTVSLTTGTITCSANITCSGGTSKNYFLVNDVGSVSVGGTFSNATVSCASGSSFNYTSGSDVNVCGGAYGGLTLSGNSIKTLTANSTVANNLNVSAGTFATTSRTLTVSGTTTIDGSISGTSGTKTFVGLFTVNSTGSVSMSGTTCAFNNGVSNSGTSCTFNTASFAVNNQALDGSSAYTISTISVGAGLTLTNNCDITVTTGITGTSGTFINAAAGALTFKGSSIAIATLNCLASGNMVTYERTLAQTIKATTYYDLVAKGAHTTTNITLATGTTTITNSFIDSATFTTGKYSPSTSSTFDFQGSTSISGSPVFHHLTISSGTLTGPSSGSFTVQGNWTNNGAFTHNSCTVVFNSTTSRTIGGSSITTFYNLTNKNTNATGLVLNVATNLAGFLDMSTTGCVFSVNGQTFTLKSTGLANNLTGAIGDLTNGTFSGNITMERYISGKTAWRMMGCPVSGKTVDNWEDFFYISGLGADTGNVNGGTFYSLYTYNEALTNGATFNDGYVKVTDSTQSISTQTGFYAYIGNTFNGTTMTPITVSLSGTPNQGDQTALVLTNQDAGASGECGYHIVANPYPCPVVFDGLVKTNADVYWAMDPADGSWNSYSTALGTGTGGAATGVIASSQAFMPVVDGGFASGSLQFVESSKTTNSAGNQFYKTGVKFLADLDLNLLSENSNRCDRAKILFKTNASDAEVSKTGDVRKISYPDKELQTISTVSSDNKRLAMNVFGGFNNAFTIPVTIMTPVTGNYVFYSKGVNLPGGQCITLKDNETGNIYDLTKDVRFTFTTITEEAHNRFVIIGSEPLNLNDEFVASTQTTAHKTILKPSNDDLYTYEVKNDNDEVVKTISKKGNLELVDLNPGTYRIGITSVNSCNNVLKTINVPSNSSAKLSSVNASEAVVYKTTEGIVVENAANSKVQIIDVTGKIMFTGDSKDAKTIISTNGFANGIYFVKLNNGNTNDSVKKIIID